MIQLKTLKSRLQSLEKEIRVAVIGIGSAGKGLVYQIQATPGMKPVAMADVHINKAIECAKWLRLDYEVVNTLADLNYCIQRGKVAVTDKSELITGSSLVHVLIESSNAVLQGALHALKAIQNHQHVVMINLEAEMMYGPVLLRAAEDEGVVYTCADGDRPAVIKRMIDDIQLWGLNIVMAGSTTDHLDRHTDPLNISGEADKFSLHHKLRSAYTDGTKLCVEMAVLANAIGGNAAGPGMRGCGVKHVNEIFRHIDFDKVWDGEHPLVDCVVGSEPKGGVFVVAHTTDKFQQSTLNGFRDELGAGPYYIFSRPYHLAHMEAMQCVAEAYLDGTARLQPVYGMRTNVYTYAKRDLKAGERLDGLGGFNSYGLIENLEGAETKPGLPILLNDRLILKRDIRKNERVGLDDVDYNPHDTAFDLHFQALKRKRSPVPVIIHAKNINLEYA